jgi:Divergent InlB B-repeat domain
LRIEWWKKWSAGAAVAGLVAACGGGGGGSSAPPDTGLPAVALDVALAGPAGAGQVVSQPAGINCGSSCRAEFAANSTVTLTATAAAGARFEGWAGACGGSTPTCSLSLSRAASVQANFSAPPASAAWSPVQTVSGLGATSDGAETLLSAIDASGRAIAVWYQRGQLAGEPPRRLLANRYLPGTGWGTPVEVAPGAATRVLLEPQLALEPASGQAMLIWAQREAPGAATTVQSRRFDPVAGWGPIEQVSNLRGGTGLRAGMDGQGRTIAVWTFVEPTGVFKLQASRHVPGGAWSAPVHIGGDTTLDAGASLAVATDGSALVVAGGFGSDLWGTRFSASTAAWAKAETVVPDGRGDRDLVHHELAVDSSGRGLLVWNQLDTSNGGTSTIVSRRYAGGWAATDVPLGAPVAIRAIDDLIRPLLRMNGRGDAVAAWGRPDQSIQVSLAPAGGPWTTPVAVKPASTQLLVFNGVQAAIDGSGKAIVAWSQRDTARPVPIDLLISSFTPGSAWPPAELHEGFTGRDEDAVTPALAMADSGAAVLAWRQVFQDVGSRIVARHLESVR